MSPHAVPPSPDSERSQFSLSDQQPHNNVSPSPLQRYSDNEVHDLICIGFGPASLAIAVALTDALELNSSSLSTPSPKVRFLERQSSFAWHAGMLLPGTKMQISFIKDMATLRNPRSEFTFLNYLHQNDRLVTFSNLGTFLPQRIEYEDYMKWCAAHFTDVVDYHQEVKTVQVGKINPSTGKVDSFQVCSADAETGRVTKLLARNVVIATGGRPNIPKPLPVNHPRVIHSSQYATHIDKIFPAGGPAPRRIAVVGGGQSAAEVFNNIPSRFPGAQSLLLIRGAALKPSDDSPFVNEVFNPSRVNDIYSQSPSIRQKLITADRATNYGVVRLELLEELYSEMYTYQIKRMPEKSWPRRILPHRRILSVRDSASSSSSGGIVLDIHNDTATYHPHTSASSSQIPDRETLDVDLLVVATGYHRNAHEDILSPLHETLSPQSSSSSSTSSSEGQSSSSGGKEWQVDRNYAVKFAPNTVSPSTNIYLQGCNEATHGLADSLLSILSVRGGEIVKSVFSTPTSSSSSSSPAEARQGNGQVMRTKQKAEQAPMEERRDSGQEQDANLAV